MASAQNPPVKFIHRCEIGIAPAIWLITASVTPPTILCRGPLSLGALGVFRPLILSGILALACAAQVIWEVIVQLQAE